MIPADHWIELPRLSELLGEARALSPGSPMFGESELGDIGATLRHKQLADIEADLAELSNLDWRVLSKKAAPYFARVNSDRRWQQGFDLLNEAKAYRYLKRTGSSPRFISEGTSQTPDLESETIDGLLLCEVKTINRSDDAIASDGTVQDVPTRLPPEFFRKLASTVNAAKQQLQAWRPNAVSRKIAYLVLNFDDRLSEHLVHYRQQIDPCLQGLAVAGLEIVCCLKPPFYVASSAHNLTHIEVHFGRG